ncbi:putative disease resistance protein [Vitis vinifera]|uniref:Putative disease resistance protein n=1 Tax=Vitis vinifera TaxID=29760 RepID=A0A438JPT5_VITVI|nr:putative disease resistance protein [Vitis vinifera]
MAEVEREEKEEVPQRRRKNKVGSWLSAVQAMEEEVEEILQNGRQEIQQKCLGTCPKNCRLPRAPVDERPMGKTVGLDLMFEKVRRCLEDEQVRSIGFGVETNQYRKNSRSDSEEIIDPEHNWKSSSKEEKTAEIFKLLKAKNFVILLDDMWERLDLLEVGIPDLSDQTKSRVVLTTRCERVCDEMEVHKRMRVECLTPDEAFSLCLTATCPHRHWRSMASRKTPREWEQAIQMLKSYPAEFSRIEDEVFPILKFSYDHLADDTIKSCFLYCSIFPEDRIIENEELIDLWIGEGFVNKFADVHKARNQGDGLLEA